ncbi:UNVERIFIED_CONTAM: hypothetical protein FKN15_027470 [Acipenser sinensis]
MDSYMIAMETSAVGGAEAQPCSTGSDQRREREPVSAACSTESDQRRERESDTAACSTESDQRRAREPVSAACSTESDQRRAREPVSAACSTGSKQQRGLESESEEEEELPGTPPQKRFRSLFFGSVLSPYSQGANQTLRNQEVLAEASDSDPEEQEEETAKK